MAISLQKGGNISLSKEAPNMTKMVLGLGWDVRATDGAAFDLDASAFLLSVAGKVRSDADFIFYNQAKSADGSVEHTGDNRTGDGDGDDEQIIVKLDSVPAEYNKIVFYATIYNGRSRGQEFSKVENAFIRAVDAGNKEIAKYNISNDPNASGKRSLVFGEAIRNGQNWEFRATGEYYNTDNLVDVAEMYKSGQNNPEERKKLFGLF